MKSSPGQAPRLISVIVPALNEADSIESVLRQFDALRKSGQVEVILVDGGSRDATRSLAEPLVDRLLLAEAGRGLQMNRGAALAKGDWLLFLHADTMLPAAWHEELARAGDHVWGRFDLRLSGRARLLRLVETLANLRSRWTGIATGDQAMFVAKEVFRELGGFPPAPLMEDIELSARLRRRGRPWCSRQKVLTCSRKWEREGIVSTVLLMWRLRFLYWLGVPAEKLVRRYYRKNSE